MSISDELGRPLSVESRKRRVLLANRWMERLFISRQSGHSDFDAVISKSIFPIRTLAWRVNNYVPRQKKV